MNEGPRSGGFIRSHQNQFSTLYRLFDVLIIFSCFWLTCHIFELPLTAGYLLICLCAAVAFMLVSESLELYRSWRFSRHREIWFTLALSWCIVACIVLAVIFYFTQGKGFPKAAFFTWCTSTWFTLSFWRWCYRQVLFILRKEGRNTRTAAIVGLTDSGVALAREINANRHLGLKLHGVYDDRHEDRFDAEDRQLLKGSIEDAIQLAKSNDIDMLYVAMPLKAEARILEILERCGDTTADVHIIPNLFIYRMLHARWHNVGTVQTLSVFDSPMYGVSSWLKRVEDLVLACVILTLISIPMLLIALGIKLTSKGPVLFKQDRYGMDGRAIKVWKFRSMRVMDNGGVVKQATKGDPRITPFGAFLRRTSLDELPQFFNVLQGSMSIVGPRPHAVAHNEEYRSLISGYMLRHKVKPGITGWAQVNGWRGETDTLDKMAKRVEFDLTYIREWTLWLDLKIVFLTVFKGFVGSNAY